jgi:hypothetical protein
MIEFALHHVQARFDVAQALSIRQLGESHAEELAPTGEALNFVVAMVAFDTLGEFVPWQEVHQLRKDGLRSKVHVTSPYSRDCKEGWNGLSISLSKNEFYVLNPVTTEPSRPHLKNVGTVVMNYKGRNSSLIIHHSNRSSRGAA